jgi:cyclopropane fatty-acyl-phospholipid synthase-like methyltransferase
MTTDQWFMALLFCGVYISCLLLLDGAHRSRIAELKAWHDAELNGMRTYIRTLNRERKWLEAELAKVKARQAQREEVSYDPTHIQWLPPSEEYGEGE